MDERRKRELSMVLMRYRAMCSEDPPPGLAEIVNRLMRENPSDPARKLEYVAMLSEVCALPEGPVESVRRQLLGVRLDA